MLILLISTQKSYFCDNDTIYDIIMEEPVRKCRHNYRHKLCRDSFAKLPLFKTFSFIFFFFAFYFFYSITNVKSSWMITRYLSISQMTFSSLLVKGVALPIGNRSLEIYVILLMDRYMQKCWSCWLLWCLLQVVCDGPCPVWDRDSHWPLGDQCLECSCLGTQKVSFYCICIWGKMI